VKRPARFVVAIGSGKGGVGKSTVTVQLALALARRGLRAGVLDADLYGPDVPLLVGVTREERALQLQLWRRGAAALQPLERYGVAVMSVGLLIGEGQALPLGAPLLTATLRQLVANVDWGERDVLLVDLPPGTADLQQQLLDVVPLDGAILVVGPQDVAHLDGRKFVDFLRSADVAILGAVENMSILLCPHCGESIAVFPPVAAERSVWSLGIRELGRVPIDPQLARTPVEPSPVFDDIAARVLQHLDERSAA